MPKYLDILAWNRLTGAIMPGLDQLPPEHRNYVRIVFTDPRMKDFYDDWTTMARTGVELLRMRAVDNPGDPRLAAIVGELSVMSVQFRQWWAARNVFQHEFGNKTIRHPELTFDWDAFATIGEPDQQLVIWSAEPGSATEDRREASAPGQVQRAVHSSRAAFRRPANGQCRSRWQVSSHRTTSQPTSAAAPHLAGSGHGTRTRYWWIFLALGRSRRPERLVSRLSGSGCR